MNRDVVVIGASAGGLRALMQLVKGLPQGLPASLFVVIHSSPDGPGMLPAMLSNLYRLPAALARSGEPIRPGHIYVAGADRHLLVEQGRVVTSRGPRENGFRPAVDPLFRSAAATFGPRVIGVILSGGLDDGTHGLRLVKAKGGVAVVQSPADALVPSMPRSAIDNVEVDHVVSAAAIGPLVGELVSRSIDVEWNPRGGETAKSNGGVRREPARGATNALATGGPGGRPSGFTCPECHGALWQLEEGDEKTMLRFRCHVGHGFTAESLLAGQTTDVERALWKALRALEETAALRRKMALRLGRGRFASWGEPYARQADEAESHASVLRDWLSQEKAPGTSRGARPVPKRRTTAARAKPDRRRSTAKGRA